MLAAFLPRAGIGAGTDVAPKAPASEAPNPTGETRSGSSQGAVGEQCAPGLVEVRHGLMTANLLMPTLTDDEVRKTGK